MLKVNCDKCGAELTRPGALVFSPPAGSLVAKLHVCWDCWLILLGWLGGAGDRGSTGLETRSGGTNKGGADGSTGTDN